MDNQKVRAHLRKGEQAVTLLESLGYKYVESQLTASRWEGPTEDEMTVFFKEFQKNYAELSRKQLLATAKPPTVCPVRSGNRFRVTSTPSGHYLAPYELRGLLFTVKSAEWIAEGSEQSVKLKGFTGWAVHFEFGHGSFAAVKTLWLPLSCIKVTSNADF